MNILYCLSRPKNTLPVALAGLTVILAGCGGGSSGDSSTATEAGVFLDSAVEGVAYQSGTLNGITDNHGTFRYQIGNTVRFMIGDILLGEAPGQPVITPVDFVPGGDATHPMVNNITRFLLTLDDDGNADNGIHITDNVRTLAGGHSIHFNQGTTAFDQDGNVQILTAELSGVTHAGARSLVSSTDAVNHLSDTILRHHAGQYDGSFNGDDTGSFDFMIDENGVITGTGHSNTGESFPLLGQLHTDGTFTFQQGGGPMFTGSIAADGGVAGSWDHGNSHGGFSGMRP